MSLKIKGIGTLFLVNLNCKFRSRSPFLRKQSQNKLDQLFASLALQDKEVIRADLYTQFLPVPPEIPLLSPFGVNTKAFYQVYETSGG